LLSVAENLGIVPLSSERTSLKLSPAALRWYSKLGQHEREQLSQLLGGVFIFGDDWLFHSESYAKFLKEFKLPANEFNRIFKLKPDTLETLARLFSLARNRVIVQRSGTAAEIVEIANAVAALPADSYATFMAYFVHYAGLPQKKKDDYASLAQVLREQQLELILEDQERDRARLERERAERGVDWEQTKVKMAAEAGWIEHTDVIGSAASATAANVGDSMLSIDARDADAGKWRLALQKANVFKSVNLADRYERKEAGKTLYGVGISDVGLEFRVKKPDGNWFTLKLFVSATADDVRGMARDYIAKLLYVKAMNNDACERGVDCYTDSFTAVLTDEMKKAFKQTLVRSEMAAAFAIDAPQYFVELAGSRFGKTIEQILLDDAAKLASFKKRGAVFETLGSGRAYSNEINVRIVRSAASALLFLHNLGIIHHGLSTENIVVVADSAEASLTDVGLRSCISGQTCESAEREALMRADVRALGWALYDWLNGWPIVEEKKAKFEFSETGPRTKGARELVVDMLRNRPQTTLESIIKRADSMLKVGVLSGRIKKLYRALDTLGTSVSPVKN
jgi:hypothetical protein